MCGGIPTITKSVWLGWMAVKTEVRLHGLLDLHQVAAADGVRS